MNGGKGWAPSTYLQVLNIMSATLNPQAMSAAKPEKPARPSRPPSTKSSPRVQSKLSHMSITPDTSSTESVSSSQPLAVTNNNNLAQAVVKSAIARSMTNNGDVMGGATQQSLKSRKPIPPKKPGFQSASQKPVANGHEDSEVQLSVAELKKRIASNLNR